jgi:hypothetical protein
MNELLPINEPESIDGSLLYQSVDVDSSYTVGPYIAMLIFTTREEGMANSNVFVTNKPDI